MTPSSDGEPPNHVSGCLFLLLWLCIVLGLVALGLFAYLSYLFESIGS
jgi:hypothetical protein